MSKRFETYTDLAKAFKDGTLDPKRYVLVIDHDSSYLRDKEFTEDDDRAGMSEAGGWFHGEGRCDAGEMCDAAGIPNERD